MFSNNHSIRWKAMYGCSRLKDHKKHFYFDNAKRSHDLVTKNYVMRIMKNYWCAASLDTRLCRPWYEPRDMLF